MKELIFTGFGSIVTSIVRYIDTPLLDSICQTCRVPRSVTALHLSYMQVARPLGSRWVRQKAVYSPAIYLLRAI